MKKYLGIMAGAALLFGMAACDDSNDYEAKVSTLEIVSADLGFANLQDTGYVYVTSPTAITAKSSASWCNVSVEDLAVRVIVSASTDYESRNAMVTIYNATDSVNVPVNQLGRVFYVQNDTTAWLVNADGTSEVDLSAKINTEYAVTASDSWIHATETSTGFKITFDSYTGEAYRKAKLTFTSPYGDEESFWFGQKSASANIADLGKYHFIYYDYSSGSEHEADITLTYDSSTKKYTIGGLVDEGNLTMTYSTAYKAYGIANGQYIGTWSLVSTTYYLYTLSFSESGSAVGYSTTALYSTYFDESITEDGNFALDLVACGTANKTPAGFLVSAFKSKSFTSANNADYLYSFLYPQFVLQPEDE